jgi:hypothetical protein
MTVHQINPELVSQFHHTRKANGAQRPITLIPFDQVELSAEPEYVIDGLIPAGGLTIVWGAPKSLKSFWVHDMAMHIALGRDLRAQGQAGRGRLLRV